MRCSVTIIYSGWGCSYVKYVLDGDVIMLSTMLQRCFSGKSSSGETQHSVCPHFFPGELITPGLGFYQ